MHRNAARIYLPIVIASMLVFFLFRIVDIEEVKNVLLESNKALLVIGVVILWGGHPFVALRWQKVLHFFDKSIKYKEVLKAYYANLPIAKIAPFYSGDFVRSYYFKDKVSIKKSLGGIFLESLIDVSVLFLFVFIGSLFLGEMFYATFSGLLLFGVLVFILFFPKFQTLLQWLTKGRTTELMEAFILARKHPYEVGQVFFLSFFMWLFTLSFTYIMFASLGTPVPFILILFLQPVAVFIGLLPVSLGGIGTRESAMLFLYSSFAPASIIFSVGLAYSFFAIVLLPLLCLPLTYTAFKYQKKERENE